MGSRIVNQSYNVRPTHGGSPAMVDGDTAMRVAVQERAYHEACLAGRYGEEEKAKAEARGLRGIAERWTEYSNRWEIEDLLTGDKCVRNFKPFKVGRRKLKVRIVDRVRLWRHEGNREGYIFGVQESGEHRGKLLVMWDDTKSIEVQDPDDTNFETVR